MDAIFFNQTQQTSSGTYSSNAFTENLSSFEIDVTRTIPRLTSSLAISLAVLLVFILSPMIIISNSILIIAIYRFKRLRTPSNYLLMSLTMSDLSIGMLMPVGMYLELGGANKFTSGRVCLISYGIVIGLCSVSILVMVAIAIDRFTSLARPLTYNNIITHSAIERCIIVFWIYSFLVGFTPFGYSLINELKHSNTDCSFGAMVAKPVQLFMFCAVYGPSALVLLICYGYVYFVARGHARAILEVRHSLRNSSTTSGYPRYGLTIVTITGMFLGLWLPFQICMIMDVFSDTNILSSWMAVYLALPILASSALNPWVYGYRNTEIRCAVRHVVDDILVVFGFTHRSRHIADPIAPSIAATAGNHPSFVNNVQRDCLSWKIVENFLLVPVAKLESSDLASECETPKIFRDNSNIYIARELPKVIRESRSMVESFAITKGSDVLVIKGTGMVHCASVI